MKKKIVIDSIIALMLIGGFVLALINFNEEKTDGLYDTPEQIQQVRSK